MHYLLGKAGGYLPCIPSWLSATVCVWRGGRHSLFRFCILVYLNSYLAVSAYSLLSQGTHFEVELSSVN